MYFFIRAFVAAAAIVLVDSLTHGNADVRTPMIIGSLVFVYYGGAFHAALQRMSTKMPG